MEISESKLGDITVVAVQGRLDTVSAGDLEKKMDGLLDSGKVLIAVDLGKVEYISSSGLRVFLAALKKVRKQKGDIMLVCMPPDIRQVFDTAGFSRLFNIFDSIQLAEAGSRSNPPA